LNFKEVLMKHMPFVLIALMMTSGLVTAQSNPVPFLDQPLVPMSAPPGGPGFTLTVNGGGFVSNSLVKWNSVALSTTFVSSSQLTATVPAADIVTAGTAAITVSNPAPGGGLSEVEYFQIASPDVSILFSNLAPFDFNTFGSSAVSGDFNGDGKLDVAMTLMNYPSQGSNSVCIQLGNGDGSFQAPVCANPSAASWFDLTAGDFNGDGKLDLAVTDSTGDQVDVFLGNGDGTLQNPKTYAAGLRPNSIVAGDFNRDGKLDLAVGDFGDSNLSIFLGNGDGTFQPRTDYPGISTYRMAVGDFNGDGILDLAGPNDNVLLGKGDGTFNAGLSVEGLTGSLVAAGDLNGDGKLDLVSTDCAEPICETRDYTVILGNGDGTFQAPIPFGNLGPADFPTNVALADVNADGTLDVVTDVSGDVGPYLYIFLGNGDGTLQAPITLPSRTFSGIAADFNNDGRVDLWSSLYQEMYQVVLQGSFPAAATSPASLTFGSQAIGTSSPAQTMNLNNDGLATLMLTGITITGADAGDFSETNNCGTTQPPMTTCQIFVTFTPTAGGTRKAAVSITDNAPGSPQMTPLTGAAIVPNFSVTGNAPASQTVTPGQVANYSVTVSPVNGFSQMVSLSCGGNPSQSTCTVTPTSVTLDGTHSATVNVAVVTTGVSTGAVQSSQPPGSERLALWLGLSGVAGVVMIGGIGCSPRRRYQNMLRFLGAACVVSLALGWLGCGGGGGGGSGGTPKGTYTLTVTGTSGSGPNALTHGATLTLVVD
jgi:hypothetical protein